MVLTSPSDALPVCCLATDGEKIVEVMSEGEPEGGGRREEREEREREEVGGGREGGERW